MKAYGQFCPVAVASEVFAQRWTPLILREIFAGCSRFNEIHRGVPLISRTLLAQRLRQLESAGVLVSRSHKNGREYLLTEAGAEFRPVIEGLGAWGQRWTVRVDPAHLDAGFLMWNLQRRIAADRLPSDRVVVRFDFHSLPRKHRGPHVFWLVLDRPQIDLCLKDPGLEVGLYVSADLATFARLWLGDVPFSAATRAGGIRLTGRRDWARAFPGWLLLSRFAKVPRPTARASLAR